MEARRDGASVGARRELAGIVEHRPLEMVNLQLRQEACAYAQTPNGCPNTHLGQKILVPGRLVERKSSATEIGIIVDACRMPGMTGADVARVIRSTPGIADTPIVMLTSVDQSLSNSTYRDLGMFLKEGAYQDF